MGVWDDFQDEVDNTQPIAWKPSEDEAPATLEGVVDTVDVFEGEYEGEVTRSPRVLLKVDGEERLYSVIGFRSILRQELVGAEPKVGDRLRVKFEGKPKGKRYFVYRVTKVAPAPSRESKTEEAPF